MTTPAAQISSLIDIRNFITAGNALFTLVSKRTGARKTFLVEQAEAKPGEAQHARPAFFVRLLIGPENTDSYRYLGFLYETPAGLHNLKINKDKWGQEAADTFSWLLRVIDDPALYSNKFTEQAEFWHAGRCGRCGRTLTVPESIATGLGPVCAGKE